MSVAPVRLHPAPAWTVLGLMPVLVGSFALTRSPVVAALVVVLALSSAWVGGSRHLVSPLLRWSLFSCALAFSASEAVRQVGLGLDDRPPAFVVLQAGLAIAAYLLGLVFVAVMVRQVAHRAGLVIWLDAAIIATGAIIVAWRYVVTPAVASGGDVAAAALQMVYVGFDALILGLVVQLTVRRVARMPAFWMLLVGFVCVLVSNLARGLTFAGLVTDAPVLALEGASIAAFCLLAAMSLHPSVADLRAEPVDDSVHARPARLTISYLALVAPTVVLVEDQAGGGLELHLRTALYLLLVTAVFGRMALAASRLVRLQSATKHRADHDELTGLLNRAATLHALQRRMAMDERDLHVLFIDVDHFKRVNDTWSHAAGDAVLQEVARRLGAACGDEAVVGRVGGDEFVVGCHEEPLALAERVRAAFGRPFTHDGERLTVTCSIGVANQGRGDVDALVADADVAMYAAKAATRNSVRRFADADRAPLALESHLRQELDGALDRGELEVHLQPLVDALDDHVSGYEALLRWRTRDGVQVPPDQFVPVADAAGLMEGIGAWVLVEACAHLARLREHSGGDEFVSVNLTARQLADPALPQAVEHALGAHGLPPQALWLELTESSMVRDPSGTDANVAVLQAAGVVIALDDFGTGFASLAHLHDIACQVVKIDRSFVSRLDHPDADGAIVVSIVAMAHALGLTVVAEGVETPAQTQRLQHLGVDYLQGYLFGRPTSVRAILDQAGVTHRSESSTPHGRSTDDGPALTGSATNHR
ncbi:putative bifunctional diguanylate cyclase/phosphodiesterase [Solicola sp. PLA-1-18]|uniref:putative bifunctional diguanylate cyclase/phosphodiesterase n=1 Tax=Solicola sp. PLA-1-18 TaxID=3380532 RepID=UPI003B7BF5FB